MARQLAPKVTQKLERVKVEHATYLECIEMDPKSQPAREFISKYQFSADWRIKTRLKILEYQEELANQRAQGLLATSVSGLTVASSMPTPWATPMFMPTKGYP